jgi:hypothetical protein
MVMTAAAGRCVVGCRVDQKWDIKPLYDRLERKKKGELDETMVEKAQSMPFTPREPSGHSLREFVQNRQIAQRERDDAKTLGATCN